MGFGLDVVLVQAAALGVGVGVWLGTVAVGPALGQTGLMDADIVVIGAGALGLSTALHCALAGRSVVVLDRGLAGGEASSRAAGLFKSVQADALRTRLALRSIAKACSFWQWADVPLDVVATGSVLIARTTAHEQYLRTERRQSAGWGVGVREIGPAEVSERVSFYVPGGAEFALWCSSDIYVEEPASLVRAYLDACRKHGAEVLEHEEVTAVTLAGGAVTGVRTAGRSVSAPVVVDAAGAWTAQVAALAGGRVPVAPVRHQLLITEPGQVGAADPIVRVVDAAVYLRPARGGLMIGGFESGPMAFDVTAPPGRTREMPLDRSVLDGFAAAVAGEVPAARPIAAQASAAEHRGGMFTMSLDGRFVVGPVPDVPGLWVASGCNGSGFSSSPALGEALADWITGTPHDLAALSPARFGPLTSAELVSRGVWQYAHYYDPAAS
jgi:glycine/D-amino acid oxidase-like deaminating enzyme